MTANPCPRCDKPIADTAYICHDCTATLRRHLERLALRWPTLRVTIDRRDRIGDPGRNNGEQPLPFAWAAADNAWAISNTITTWARDIEEARGMTIPTTHGGRPLPVEIVCALWLSTQLDWLRHRDYAEQAFDELEDAAFSLYRVIDRPAQRMFLGACPTCQGRLYAPPGRDYTTCQDCDTQINVTVQRDTLLAAANDQARRRRDHRRRTHHLGRTTASQADLQLGTPRSPTPPRLRRAGSPAVPGRRRARPRRRDRASHAHPRQEPRQPTHQPQRLTVRNQTMRIWIASGTTVSPSTQNTGHWATTTTTAA